MLPLDVFEFIASGARDERTLAAYVAAWRAYWLVPRLLMDVAAVRTATEVLGQPIALPVLAAPMSVLGLVHADGDLGLVRATVAAGTIAVISQSSLTPLDAIAAVPGARFWAGHYPLVDRQVEEGVVRDAVAAGAGGIVVTLDGAIPTAAALAEIVEAVHERVEVYVDGGVRAGRTSCAR